MLIYTKPLLGAKGGRKRWPCFIRSGAFSVLCPAVGTVAFGSHCCPGRPASVRFLDPESVKQKGRWGFAEVSSGRREHAFPEVARGMVSCTHGGHLVCAFPVRKGQIRCE